MQALGVKYVRMDFRWPDLEKTRDAPWAFTEKGSWSPKESYDTYVGYSQTYGIEIIACLLAVPSWILPGEINIPTGSAFDDFVTQYGEFVYAVVDHYKGNITYFEIWNEPNYYKFWDDAEGTLEHGAYNRGKAITKYATLLKEAYVQAKAANPNCIIISGGVSENDYVYVQGIYDNGAKGYFDYLGLHPYFGHGLTKNYDPDYVDWADWEYWHFPKIELVRDVMVAEGDGARNVFVTELGVDSESGPEGATTEEIQARALRRVFEKIDHDPGYPYVDAVMWYQLKDTHAGNWGLFTADYTPRQMYYAYKQLIPTNPT